MCVHSKSDPLHFNSHPHNSDEAVCIGRQAFLSVQSNLKVTIAGKRTVHNTSNCDSDASEKKKSGKSCKGAFIKAGKSSPRTL